MESSVVSNHKTETTDRPVADQPDRDRVEQVQETNLMVLAGAGAGKTYSLIKRMVYGVRTGHIDVKRTAAITFTRKAAGEMRGRFFTALRVELSNTDDATEKQRLQEAADHIDQCFIGTIHSFCARLLRERPVEAGLSPDFTELEKTDEEKLQRESWDAFITRQLANGDSRLTGIQELGLELHDLYDSFERRCGFIDLDLKKTDVPQPDLNDAVQTAVGFAERYVSLLSDKGYAAKKGAARNLRKAIQFLAVRGLNTPAEQAEFLKMLDMKIPVNGSADLVQNQWETGVGKTLKDEIWPEFQKTVVGPALRSWRQYLYGRVVPIINEAVEYYAGIRHQTGQLTFQDLLLKASSLLRDNPEVRSFLHDRYKTLLVDEFQDTDPVQAEVLAFLTANEKDETDWKKCTPAKGSLFVVGDAKQSIYRFRRADLDVFNFVQKKIENAGGETAHLNTSFRSLGKLCNWFNAAFPDLFSAGSLPYQTRFSPLLPHLQEGVDATCVRQLVIAKVNGNYRAPIVAQEAPAIAAFVSAALRGETEFNGDGDGAVFNGPAKPGDFLILTRNRKFIGEYAKALEALGIPCDTTGTDLGDREEVKVVFQWLSAAYNPDNPVNIVAALRGPLSGFSDSEFYEYSRAGGDFDPYKPLPDGLDKDLHDRLDRIFTLLRYTRKQLSTRSPGDAVEEILAKLGWILYSVFGADGSTRAGSLLRLITLVRNWAGSGREWPWMLRELAVLCGERRGEFEGASLEAGSGQAVRIMNLHQAKGLQGKVVILADCGKERDKSGKINTHVVRNEESPYISMTITKPNGPFNSDVVAEPVGWEEDLEEEKKYAAAEEVRLLYVAATRAERLLVVCKYDDGKAGPWSQLTPALKEMPELDKYEPVSVDSNVSSSNSLKDWESRLKEKVEFSKGPTYRKSKVTELNRFSWQPGDPEGEGKEFGNVVHKVLEAWVAGRLPNGCDVWLSVVAKEERLASGLIQKANDVVDLFCTSEIAKEVSRAKEVYPEAEIAFLNENGDLVRGTIDLVYRVDGGWKMVDYKTEQPEPGQQERMLAHYREQVCTYRDCWETATGEKVVSAVLWTPTMIIPVT